MAAFQLQDIGFAVLTFVADGQTYSYDDIRAGVEASLRSAKGDTRERDKSTPGSVWHRFTQRLSQALCYLRRAGMVERSQHWSLVKITPVGQACLKSGPESDTFCAPFFAARRQPINPGSRPRTPKPSPTMTPQQILTNAHEQAQQAIVPSILKELRRSPVVFSKAATKIAAHLVSTLVKKSDPAAAKKGKSTALHSDQGVRFIDKEVLVHIAPKAGATVDRAQIKSFVEDMTEKKAQRGFFISAGSIEPSARACAATAEKHITLLSIDDLAWMMVELGIGVKTVATFAIREVDTRFFSID
jgi:restriction system protein